MNQIKQTKRYIYFIYAYVFLSTFILFYSCDTLFYLERGLTSSDYMIFVATIFLVHILCEIPFGILADKYSRKKILLVSNVLCVLSICLFIISHNFLLFMIATIVKGMEQSLVTGVANSLLYDITPKKEKFSRILFRKEFFYNISYMIAVALGGYIGERYGLVTTYYLSLIPIVLNFFVIFSLPDVKKQEQNYFVTKKDILHQAINEIKNHHIILNALITSSLLSSAIKLVEESHPEYSAHLGISVFWIGIYTALILVFCIIGGYLGSKVSKKYTSFVLACNSFFVGCCILIMGLCNQPIGILFLLCIYIFSESYENVMLSTVHHTISSKSRVTVESIFSMSFAFFGFILSLCMSFFLRFMKVYQLYVVLGMIVIFYGIINMFFYLKKR